MQPQKSPTPHFSHLFEAGQSRACDGHQLVQHLRRGVETSVGMGEGREHQSGKHKAMQPLSLSALSIIHLGPCTFK